MVQTYHRNKSATFLIYDCAGKLELYTKWSFKINQPYNWSIHSHLVGCEFVHNILPKYVIQMKVSLDKQTTTKNIPNFP